MNLIGSFSIEWLRLCGVALLGASSCLLSAQPHARYEQGFLVEANRESPCAYDCLPFEPVYFDFCVQNGANIVLARLFDTRFNYDPDKFHAQVGKPIQFRADDKNLWIVRPDGKEFRIRQNYSAGTYTSDRCVAELHRHLLAHDAAGNRPPGTDLDAVYVPLSAKVGYWTKCFLAADRAIVCFARGPKGEEFSHVYQPIPEVHTNSDLRVDPLRTNYDVIVLAIGKTLVRKYD